MLSIGAGLVAVAAVVGAALALAAWPYAATALDGQPLQPLESRDHPPGGDVAAPPADTRNLLLVQRPSAARRSGDTQRAAAERHPPTAVVLVQTSSVRDRPVVLSFPPDLKVQPPGHPPMRLVEAHLRGGPELLITTVEDYVGLDLDHYVEVDPVALAGGLAHALDGVRVCLDEPTARGAPLALPRGCHRLSAARAVRFVRPGDGEAAEPVVQLGRQRVLLSHALAEATRLGSMLNPWRLKAVLDVASASVLVTDRDPGLGAMWRLASGLADSTPVVRTVPASPGNGETGYVHALPEQAGALFQALRRTSAIPAVGTYDPPSVRLRPRQVVVTVLNGAGARGLAADAAELLTSKGYRIATVGNAPQFGRRATVIRHAPGQEARARLVARALPGATLEALEQPPGDGAHVVVVLGAEAQERIRRAAAGTGPERSGAAPGRRAAP